MLIRHLCPVNPPLKSCYKFCNSQMKEDHCFFLYLESSQIDVNSLCVDCFLVYYRTALGSSRPKSSSSDNAMNFHRAKAVLWRQIRRRCPLSTWHHQKNRRKNCSASFVSDKVGLKSHACLLFKDGCCKCTITLELLKIIPLAWCWPISSCFISSRLFVDSHQSDFSYREARLH